MPPPNPPAPTPPPAAPPAGDLSESVAGEEDPGAALDQAPVKTPGPHTRRPPPPEGGPQAG